MVEHLEELAKKEEKSMTMVIQDLIEGKYQEISKEEKLEAFYAFAGSGNGLFGDMTIQSIKAMKGDKGEKYGASLLSQETGLSLHETISKLSADYFVKLRNYYSFIPVVVQQQAIAGESDQNVKDNRLFPTVSNLAENKLTFIKCNLH